MHRVELRPLFGDVDAMNVVYYGNYLRFFERGRAELMRAAGFPYRLMAQQGLHLPAVEAGLRYLHPARYDDLIAVETSVAWLKRASLLFSYRILGPDDQGRERELVLGFTKHGCVDQKGKVQALPAVLRRALQGHLEEKNQWVVGR
ncbi:MAG: thioesterase family protein [Thermodesulfobacteriota bacterium]